jgi:hypothetical protein
LLGLYRLSLPTFIPWLLGLLDCFLSKADVSILGIFTFATPLLGRQYCWLWTLRVLWKLSLSLSLSGTSTLSSESESAAMLNVRGTLLKPWAYFIALLYFWFVCTKTLLFSLFYGWTPFYSYAVVVLEGDLRGVYYFKFLISFVLVGDVKLLKKLAALLSISLITELLLLCCYLSLPFYSEVLSLA